MKKNDLRLKYKLLRKKLQKKDIDDLSLQIANQILSLDIWTKCYFHIFLPIESQNEVNTELILNVLQVKDKEVVVAKSNFETLEMTHYLLNDNTTIKLSKFNIPEPENGIEVPIGKIEVVFVPLLAFDKTGNRVGYGKGFYDLFLSKCDSKTIKIGLSFFEPEALIEDISDNDIKLDYCIMPDKIYSFKDLQ